VVKRAYSMADYFRWQIEMDRMVAKYPKRVLFGAGNMCRNYMRDYGKKYPPLFTVDNDSKVWGTVFEGLEVKSPEELKMLDEDTAIFICITYYREINEQLRGMGITNPIEYFNDEYPNTVYAGERLEREWSE
jgi:FlaA1/EpsC-like NDP-sugar epimerase